MLIVSVVVFASSAFAQNDEIDSQGEVQQLTPISVTAPIVYNNDIDFENLTSPFELIVPEDFPSDAQMVSDVLESVSSVQLQSLGGVGSFQILSIRGANAKQIPIYINGVKQPNINGEFNQLGQMPISSIQRIEIYKSGSPSQLGYTGIGGAINIITLSSDNLEKLKGQLTTSFGSFGLYRFSSNIQFGTQSRHWNINGQTIYSENNFPFRSFETPDVQGDDELLYRNNAQFYQHNLSILYSMRKTESKKQFGLEFEKNQKNLPTAHNSDASETHYKQNNLKVWVSLFNNNFLNSFDSSTHLEFNIHQGKLNDPNDLIGLRANESTDRLQSITVDQSFGKFIGENKVNFKANYSVENYDFQDELVEEEVSYSQQSIAATTSISLPIENLIVDAQLNANSVLSELDQTANYTIHSTSQIGVLYHLGDFKFSTNLGLFNREPTVLERFGNTGMLKGNDEILPEESKNIDFGIQLDNPIYNTKMNVFYRKTINNIIMLFDSQGIGRAENLESARYYGADISFETVLKNISFQYSGYYQNSKIISHQKAFNGKSVPGIYHLTHDVLIGKEFDISKFKLISKFKYINKDYLFYDRFNSTLGPGINQYGLDQSVKLKNHSVSLVLDNIGNQMTYDIARKPLPAFKITFNYNYNF